ncbi:uncharacterized protein B0H18DRAFT_955912 [Fomitopsis serialis]|uniref:uncharacterized protein n=1 Tax=Fomitopsis serialis TaxID=139415 RepID=UPI00200736D7|nr:uncharacterized protein B0H18DRAFT_955912 [Neoantrodia serialis]KAH9923374.1 hypothetical protein B0H18DRAFT_955912 [Neoantrodia serialis]
MPGDTGGYKIYKDSLKEWLISGHAWETLHYRRFFATCEPQYTAEAINGQLPKTGKETNHIWQVSMSASKTPLIPVELSSKHAYQDLLICLSITSHVSKKHPMEKGYLGIYLGIFAHLMGL